MSKKLRFDVFKRDGFQCQYCGRNPPEVILEPDHIHPVAKGGSNDIDNLVTACFDCNRGKAASLLSAIPQSINEKAVILKEKEEQLKAYQKLLRSKHKRLEAEIDQVSEIYSVFVPGYELSEQARVTVRLFIERLGVSVVEDAMRISGGRWKHRDNKIFKYFCGICWNRIRELNDAQ
jgi:hypothetical protein